MRQFSKKHFFHIKINTKSKLTEPAVYDSSPHADRARDTSCPEFCERHRLGDGARPFIPQGGEGDGIDMDSNHIKESESLRTTACH